MAHDIEYEFGAIQQGLLILQPATFTWNHLAPAVVYLPVYSFNVCATAVPVKLLLLLLTYMFAINMLI